jgi:ubiquinol oxidase
MESLGGDQLWVDRFMAQHAAILYYIILVGLFSFSPQLAYNFSELIEAHAVDTYGEAWVVEQLRMLMV